IATSLPNTHHRRMILTSAAVIAVGLGAYGLGRVYPPTGPSAGTIAPADRYVSSQVTDADVTLGDTTVPQLMQTDAFELFVHDKNFRALASSPGFQTLASQPQVMAALIGNPQAFADLASHPEAFASLVKAAQSAGSIGSQSREASADIMGIVAGHPAAMEAFAAHPDALSAILKNPSAFERYANNPQAFTDAAVRVPGLQQLAQDRSAMSKLMSDSPVFE